MRRHTQFTHATSEVDELNVMKHGSGTLSAEQLAEDVESLSQLVLRLATRIEDLESRMRRGGREDD